MNVENIKQTELAILGLTLKNPKIIYEIEAQLDRNCFSDERNASIFLALIDLKQYLNEDNSQNDIEIAEKAKQIYENEANLNHFSKEHIKMTYKDWYDLLGLILYSSGFKSQINTYIKTLQEFKRKNDISKILLNFSNNQTLDKFSSLELISDIQSRFLDLSKDIQIKDFTNIEDYSSQFISKLSNMTLNQNNIKTKWFDLDKIINGFNKGDLVILAARPSMGKTAFALDLSFRVSSQNNVAIFSIEMPNDQLMQRLISSYSGIFINKVRDYQSLSVNQKDQINNAVEELSKRKIWLDDTPGIRLSELVWKARKLNSMQKLDLIIIDYLQLIESDNKIGNNRNQEVSEISRTLKSLARELEVPIIALSQLSRRVESREDKRPMMSDLRESGSLEQDADLIMFLYRDGYYNKKNQNNNLDKNFEEDIEVIVSKHRNGPTGTAVLLFNSTINKFKNKN